MTVRIDDLPINGDALIAVNLWMDGAPLTRSSFRPA
jgi:hypothetical protein